MNIACTFFLVLLLASTGVSARGLPTRGPLRGLTQAAADVIPTEVPAVSLATPMIESAAVAATAATAVTAAADLDPANALPAPAAVDPAATAEPATADAVPTAQATAAVEASDLADVPPYDAVTQGVAADNTLYVPSPAVGPVRRRHSTSKHYNI